MSYFEFGQDGLAERHALKAFELVNVRSKFFSRLASSGRS